VEKEFMGMTYRYHADALTYPSPEYHAIRAPFLVVVGTLDPFIDSCDAFVEKAGTAGAQITYIRVPDMDHYVRTRLDIIEQTFEWLKAADCQIRRKTIKEPFCS
jgi:acetyl esterase/lipase